MGIFNFFIVIPQLVAASLLGFLLRKFLGDDALNALAVGGISLIVSGLCVLRVAHPTPQSVAVVDRKV
jgi:maltose/moltooligosaccharide transporter